MKKFLSVACAVAVVSIIGASPANAQFWERNATYKASGNLNLYQTIPGVWCHAELDISVNNAGVATVTNGTFSGGSFGLCGSQVYPRNFPWNVSSLSVDAANDKGTIAIEVDVKAGNGECVGTLDYGVTPLELTWGPTNANEIIAPVGAKSPGTSPAGGASADCFVDGILTVNKVTATTDLRMEP